MLPDIAPPMSGVGLGTDDTSSLQCGVEAQLDLLEAVLTSEPSLDQVIGALALADATRVVVKRLRGAHRTQVRAAALRLEAQRAAGVMLAASPRNGGGGNHRFSSGTGAPTLEQLGVNKKESHRWQRLAAVPEETFRAFLSAACSELRLVTLTEALRLGREDGASERNATGARRRPAVIDLATGSSGEGAGERDRKAAGVTWAPDDQDREPTPADTEGFHVLSGEPALHAVNPAAGEARGLQAEGVVGRACKDEQHLDGFRCAIREALAIARLLGKDELQVALREAEGLVATLTGMVEPEGQPADVEAPAVYDDTGEVEPGLDDAEGWVEA